MRPHAFLAAYREGCLSADSVPDPELRLDVEKKPAETTIRGQGKLTSDTINVLHETFRSILPGPKSVVLDLSDVSYIDSSGLGALLGVYISAQRVGCELQLSNLGHRTEDLLRITRLGSIFKKT
jgi:anti-sigma B factor antagonist